MEILEAVGVSLGGGGTSAVLIFIFLKVLEKRIFRAEAKALTAVSMTECDTHRQKIRDDAKTQEDCVESELIEIKGGLHGLCSDIKVIKSAMVLTTDDQRVVDLLKEE